MQKDCSVELWLNFTTIKIRQKKPKIILDSILPPGVFEGALHAFLIGEFFIESIRMTIRSGVCNCSRVIQVGAIYGALSGVEAILQDLDTENSCL